MKEGTQASIITYGQGVHWALDWSKNNPEIAVDIVDLRTLMPLDTEAIIASAKKTGRILVLQEDCLFGGIASDISAIIHEKCFAYLDAPVMRLGSMDTPVPFAATLEKGFLPVERLDETMQNLLKY
jgi:2-oxoisovalerate dehydrogenase E1 component